MLLAVFLSACWIGIALADSGPHLANDWGEPVRLRHLYAARPGLHLQISKDGKIGGSHVQSSLSEYQSLTPDQGGKKSSVYYNRLHVNSMLKIMLLIIAYLA